MTDDQARESSARVRDGERRGDQASSSASHDFGQVSVYPQAPTGASQLAPPAVESVVRRSGQPLDAEARALVEPRFGMNFSSVRVHDDAEAQRSAAAINAAAYTVGQHIVLGADRPAPQSSAGRALLAHELAHTVQQRHNPETPDGPIEVAPSETAEEREADSVGRRVAGGDDAGTIPTSRSTPGRTMRLQRAEIGTYVSTVGEPAYLNAGAAFYRHWSYPNVQRVSSMEDVVSDLDRRRGHIDSFRLVAHGARGEFQFGFLGGIPTTTFSSTEAAMRSPQEFRTATAQTRLLDDATFTAEVNDLIADAMAGPLLSAVGVTSVPTTNSPIGLYLRGVLEAHFLNNVRLPDDSVPNIPNRAVLNRLVQLRRDLYLGQVIADTPAAQQATARGNLVAMEARVPAALQGKRNFRFPQAEIDTLADPFLDPAQPHQPRLNPEIERIAREGAGGPYVTKLARVRNRIDHNTHIEIRGCNVGGDTGFLDMMRSHFGNTGSLPSISAPDLFQYFFQIADVATFRFNQQADQQRFAADFPHVEQAFVGMERIRRREAWPVTNESSLAAFATRYGFNLNNLRLLNPEYATREPRQGDLVWLVARQPIPAGNAATIEDFCQQVLGDRLLWPRIWGYNPQLRTPALTPQDRLWVVPDTVRNQLAAPAPSQQDLQASLQAGNAFVGFVGARVVVRLDDRQGVAAFTNWLAAQGFDARGRNAAGLAPGFRRNFGQAVLGTHVQFLSPSYPEVAVDDALFPTDPRYPAHIIHRP